MLIICSSITFLRQCINLLAGDKSISLPDVGSSYCQLLTIAQVIMVQPCLPTWYTVESRRCCTSQMPINGLPSLQWRLPEYSNNVRASCDSSGSSNMEIVQLSLHLRFTSQSTSVCTDRQVYLKVLRSKTTYTSAGGQKTITENM